MRTNYTFGLINQVIRGRTCKINTVCSNRLYYAFPLQIFAANAAAQITERVFSSLESNIPGDCPALVIFRGDYNGLSNLRKFRIIRELMVTHVWGRFGK